CRACNVSLWQAKIGGWTTNRLPTRSPALRSTSRDRWWRVSGSTLDVPLLLVDGMNLLFRAWFGFPARIRSRDKRRDLTGVFGFFALLRVAIREVPAAPEVIVVFDGEGAWDDRLALDPTYKAHRSTDPDALAPIRSLPSVYAGLDVLGISRVESETVEADDLIATLTVRSAAQSVYVLSMDRDFYQLVDDRVRILNTARPSDRRILESKDIEARFGVLPRQWCDRTALVGDPSDGIPGVRGIGPVWAARLLADGLRLEDLPVSGRLTGRAGQLVAASLDQALRWRELIRLRTNISVPVRTTGRPSAPLPAAAEVVAALELW
ncbi:MAG TPA: 5'-3' exonuclease H3TH domain-containing protein, partial [Actinopolymorphaceae bacterium]